MSWFKPTLKGVAAQAGRTRLAEAYTGALRLMVRPLDNPYSGNH